MINGKNYSWEDISIQLPHGTLIGIEDIEYSDEKETEANYGKGSNPISYGEGNYSAQGKLTLTRGEFQRLLDHVKKNAKSLYGLQPFPIIASYANDNQPAITDKLPLCKFNTTKSSGAQNDKKINVELEFIILKPIEWDGVPAN